MKFHAVCAACHEHIGTTENVDDLDAIAIAHDFACTATAEQKRQAAFELRLRHFTAQEGLNQ